ncbi:DNA-binding domain-containing protein [Aquibium sp. ELW1220]|uniref:HvfC/BufC N-terminal domain-containing protein n=1 Tax=Aquibium sp. ELW1220 TaxID=2976766 RepID=UPI0025B031F1|nr:DNA-binding domain-containing protein [Aquibium sp. ELW1220]MDN2580506.1 DNA-binding domain-containing protein [Aquibium sp. ELW1220]
MPRSPEPAANAGTGFAAGFAASLLDPGRATPPIVSTTTGGRADRRYAVYRNNVTTSLADALADIFPAVRRLVGDAFFSGMAIAFARAHPPRSRLLFQYGHDFPAFVASFEPARDLPYLADVASIERAWLDAFHAADADPLPPQVLGTIPPDDLPAVVFHPHPALRILRSPYAAFSICTANRDGREPDAPIRGDVAEDTLVTRPGLIVSMRRLPPGTAAFLLALVGGSSFGAAIGTGFADTEEFAPAEAIRIMLNAGAFVAVGASRDRPSE